MFITLTNIENPRHPKPLHVLASSIEGILHNGSCTAVRTAGGCIWHVAEAPDQVLGLLDAGASPAGLTRQQIQNIVHGFMQHDDEILFMANVDALLNQP